MLQPGDAAPKFSLASSTGKILSLDELLKKGRLVLYFYPRADTPGCTTEACGFRDSLAGYKSNGASVVGVSPDPVDNVKKFAEKFHLDFPLLADEDHSVADQFGVWGEKSMYGKKYLGVLRTTFIIVADGKIQHVFQNVKPAGHDRQVLDWMLENP